jgi:hypothetical protein
MLRHKPDYFRIADTILPQTLGCSNGDLSPIIRASASSAPSSYKFAAIPRRNPCQPYQSILIASTTGRMARWANFRSSSAFRLRGETSRPFWDCPWNSDKHSRSRPTAESHGQVRHWHASSAEKADAFDMREALGLINSDESKSDA